MTVYLHRTRWLWTLLLSCLLWHAAPLQAACNNGACLSAGPRLLSVSTTQSALLNPLLGGLLGTNLSLSVADWNALAQGDLNLLAFLNALKLQAGVSTPAQALTASVSLGQVLAALEVVAQAEGKLSLYSVLGRLQSQLSSSSATIRVGELLKLQTEPTALGSATLNGLDMLTGVIQLYNYRNMISTPTPVGISGGALGMLGVLNSLQLYAQVIEPPVYVCGPVGTQFHTAAVRTKLKLDLVTLSPVTNLLTALPLVYNARIAISRLDVYVEVGRAEGSLVGVDAVLRAVTLDVSPGVADVYLGSIPDSVFFNRSRAIDAARDLGYGEIGALELNALKVAIEIKASSRGQAPFSRSVTLSGNFPQTSTVSTSSSFATSLVDGLVTNLSLKTSPDLGLLDVVVQPVLKVLVLGVLSPILTPILTGAVDPLLELLGLGLGKAQVTVYGIAAACDGLGLIKSVDKATALPGDVLTYTILYENTGTTTLNTLRLLDATPTYTVFHAGACGPLPSGLTSCSIPTVPAAGSTGVVEWHFGGTLAPGEKGSVTFSVKVE